MFNLKRLGSVALSLTMVFSMAGCGSRSTTVKKSAVDVSNVESVADAIELSTDYTVGNYKFNFEVSDDDTKIKAGVSGKTDGKNATAAVSFDMNVDGESFSYDLGEIITVADGRAYFDIDAILKAILKTDTKLGSYGLLLPEYENIKATTQSDKGEKFYEGLVEALVQDIEAQENDGEFTIKIDTAEEYKNITTRVINYLADNKEEFKELYEEAYNSASAYELIDYDKYINDLYDDISSDIVSAAEVFGIPIAESTIAEYKEEVLAAIHEAMEDVETEGDFELDVDAIDELKQQLAEVTDEEWEEELGGISTVITVKATKDQFAFKIAFDIDNDEEKASANISYTFDVDDSVKVTKPSNAATLTDMANYLKDNPDVMQELIGAIDELD